MQIQTWIRSPKYDLGFIIAPSFFVIFLLFFFPENWLWSNEMPNWAWFVLVLLIDVSHVYSSLYRTYFDKKALQKHAKLFILTPLFVVLIAGSVHLISNELFWRLAAYLAVFHFIRQQYGFLKLYTRSEGIQKVDIWMIYISTVFPVLYWHFSEPRNFVWFTANDFYFFPNQTIAESLKYIIWLLTGIYYVYVLIDFIKNRTLNLPKMLLILSTQLTWYFGIVYFNGDMAFTMLNVVAHGIPYMALVYATEQKKKDKKSGFWKLLFSNFGALIFVGILFLLAYFEEGFWNGLVWHEYDEYFSFFPTIDLTDNLWLSITIAILSMPQLTHYILDGYIWKRDF
ncbi:hypothetical protein EMA8858_00730 [Emticicia aquatica]|uniref:Uncharacterized protein n=1 Tax=Emticicia aquatica TaxID=1681835 RepID=A0ABN8ENZ5_9BACT|nr:hypothetical protein [Emticicia aquatica]CAH0994619.1 hypothetical protein EMA8858_00730 [Emticicia aquatica]